MAVLGAPYQCRPTCYLYVDSSQEIKQPLHVEEKNNCSPRKAPKHLIFVTKEDHVHLLRLQEVSVLLEVITLLVTEVWRHYL